MPTYKNFIGGEWRDGETVWGNVNTSEISDIVGHYEFADVRHTLEVIEWASVSFPSWVHCSLEKRSLTVESPVNTGKYGGRGWI